MPWKTSATGKPYWEAEGSSTVKGEGAYDETAQASAQKQEAERKKLQAQIKSKPAAGMPKQEAGESPSAYGGRLRKWREEQTAGEGQKKAMRP